MTTTTLAQAETKARGIVNGWTAAAAGVGWVPGSSLMLGVADVAMIHSVAEAFHVSEATAEGVFGSLAAGVGGKMMATELLSFIPGPGWVIKAAVSAEVTKTLGESFISEMNARSPPPIKFRSV